jgi:hypothetical protein
MIVYYFFIQRKLAILSLMYTIDQFSFFNSNLFLNLYFRAEYSVFWKYLQTGFLYLFVQFCKMMVLATFFPAFDDSKFDVLVVSIKKRQKILLIIVNKINFNKILKEFLKITVDLGDLIGLHIAMTKIAGKCEIKYLVAGVGWASAELIMTK